MEILKLLIILIFFATLSGCSPKIQERIVYETDTTFIEKEVRVTDTVYKYRTIVKYEVDSIYLRDTLQTDTLTLESNYSYAKAWLAWPHLKGEIQDKDTVLSFKQDSARVNTNVKKTNKKTKTETITNVVKEKYVPWYIYMLWGLSIGLTMYVRLKP